MPIADRVGATQQLIAHVEGIRQESERVERLEKAIREAVPEWSLAEVVAALQAMRGIDLIAAVGCWPRLVISPAFKIRAS
jgi:hypothetical protein